MSWTPTDEQVEEAAGLIQPLIVEPDRTRLMDAWRLSGGLDADQCMAETEHEAYTKARAVLVAVGPMIAAQALRDAAYRADADLASGNYGRGATWLRDRADTIEKEAGR